MCIVIACFPVYDVKDFEVILSFLIKPFSYMTKKIKTKFKYLPNEKNKKHFFIIFEGLALKKIKLTVLEGESPVKVREGEFKYVGAHFAS